MAVRYFPLYNIDMAVGPGKANQPADVRLVQALMVELAPYDVGDWFANLPATSRTLATSGRFDDTLATWIVTFQSWSAKSFGIAKFKVDGVVDPMPVTSISAAPSFSSGRISTLAFLCNRLWRYNRNAYLRIGDDYHIPWVPRGFGQ